jgi:hypothetical protein
VICTKWAPKLYRSKLATCRRLYLYICRRRVASRHCCVRNSSTHTIHLSLESPGPKKHLLDSEVLDLRQAQVLHCLWLTWQFGYKSNRYWSDMISQLQDNTGLRACNCAIYLGYFIACHGPPLCTLHVACDLVTHSYRFSTIIVAATSNPRESASLWVIKFSSPIPPSSTHLYG